MKEGGLSDPKQIKSKVRLPSLGSNMYIITTSTRLINKTWCNGIVWFLLILLLISNSYTML